MSTWIDFKELRAKLTFEQILRHYGVEAKIKGTQHHGYCPLPNHNGKKNSPSFSANLEKGIFQCFGCGAKGNVLEFAVLMENVDPKDGAAFRKVAGELPSTTPFIEGAPATFLYFIWKNHLSENTRLETKKRRLEPLKLTLEIEEL